MFLSFTLLILWSACLAHAWGRGFARVYIYIYRDIYNRIPKYIKLWFNAALYIYIYIYIYSFDGEFGSRIIFIGVLHIVCAFGFICIFGIDNYVHVHIYYIYV